MAQPTSTRRDGEVVGAAVGIIDADDPAWPAELLHLERAGFSC